MVIHSTGVCTCNVEKKQGCKLDSHCHENFIEWPSWFSGYINLHRFIIILWFSHGPSLNNNFGSAARKQNPKHIFGTPLVSQHSVEFLTKATDNGRTFITQINTMIAAIEVGGM